MGVQSHSPSGRTPRVSPATRQMAEWFRNLDHLVQTARSMGATSPQVTHQRDLLAEQFVGLAEFHAPIVLRISPLEVWLRDELVVRGPEPDRTDLEPIERRVPFILYRDGVRGITVDANATHHDAVVLLDAIAHVVGSPCSDEDLVTLMWRADLDGLRIEVAPLEPPSLAQTGETGESLEADTSSARSGAVPGTPANALAAWRAFPADAAAAHAEWRELWRTESARCWPERVEDLVERVISQDSGAAVRESLTHALVNWLASSAQRNEWNEAAQALVCLRHVDPDRQWSQARIASTLSSLDAESIADRLDEADHETVARFFALVVRVGRPALDLAVRVIARSSRQRVRAAATTALTYVCADEPRALAPYLRDTRWHVARNVVFALGQMGGEETGELLANAMRHPEQRVRRAAVSALGQVPAHRRTPLLVGMLDGCDAATLATVLAMLMRDPDPRASVALAERLGSADFESRPPEERLAFIDAIGEIGTDAVLPVLERALHAGGWFARRTPERTAVAHAIARIGTPPAITLLQDGLRARAEAVRTACTEALGRLEKTA